MGDSWVNLILVAFSTAMGSSGFWIFVRDRKSRRSATTRLMMGLACTEITKQGLDYIERGSITKDEYEDFEKYLYMPYRELGGNGVAQRIMRDVANLPFRPHDHYSDIFRNREEGWINNVRIVTAHGQEASTE